MTINNRVCTICKRAQRAQNFYDVPGIPHYINRICKECEFREKTHQNAPATKRSVLTKTAAEGLKLGKSGSYVRERTYGEKLLITHKNSLLKAIENLKLKIDDIDRLLK